MRQCRPLLAVTIALSIVSASRGQIALNYQHKAGSITKDYNKEGGIVKGNPGYKFDGNGTPTITISDPSKRGENDPKYKIWAVAGLDGFTRVFFGSSATGTANFSGVYTINGVPAQGAVGTLEGTAVYNNYIGTAGIGKVLGTGSTTITSNISVAPFAAKSPGPNPATTEVSAGFGTNSGGQTDDVSEGFNATATVNANGTHTVSEELKVTASRTGGAVTATAAWIKVDYNWSFAAGPVAANVNINQDGDGGFTPNQPTRLASMTGLINVHNTSATPENLLVSSSGQLINTSMDPSSVTSPDQMATAGPSFRIESGGSTAVTGLAYTAALAQRSSNNQIYSLQSFSYGASEFNVNNSALQSVNLALGTVTNQTLSSALDAPSAMAFGEGGMNGQLIVSELGLGSLGTARLSSIDVDTGTVTTLISNLDALGIQDPIKLAAAPVSFGSHANDMFVLNVGDFTNSVIQNGTGSILTVDDTTHATTLFATNLLNPVSMAFGDGGLLGHAGQEYLYVLSKGDVDPTTGIPLGTGTLTAYDAFGNATTLVADIYDPTSVAMTTDGILYFTSGDTIYAATVPEFGSVGLCAIALSVLGMGIKRRMSLA